MTLNVRKSLSAQTVVRALIDRRREDGSQKGCMMVSVENQVQTFFVLARIGRRTHVGHDIMEGNVESKKRESAHGIS